MSASERVAGIELSPVFVVATESEASLVGSADYIHGVPLRQLLVTLRSEQHVYLVHLHTPGPGHGVKLTRLT